MGRKNKELPDVSEFAAKINDSFLANMNHAMRTPLNALVGMIELMTKTGLDENQLKYARIMRESTELLMLQLDNIVDLANIENKDLELHEDVCRLEDVIRDALQPVIPLAVKKKIPLTSIYGPGVPEAIYTDARKLKKVLTNVLSCSLKFAERGKIIINVTREQIEGGNKLRFSIENDQMLYDSLITEMQQFKDFSTTDLREFGEISVSLLTAKKLLMSLGANESSDNLDSHKLPFYFELDISEEAEVPVDSSYQALEGKRALILQKKDDTGELLQQSLKLWGVDYKRTANEKTVNTQLRAAVKEGRPFDLLFFSECLPTVDLEEFGDHNPHVVLISSDFQFLSKSLHIEFAAYLCPPIYPNELLSTLLSFYEDREPYRESTLSEEASQHVSNESFEPIEAKVLLVEDDFVSRMYAAEILESFGCKVAIAENGLHALTKLSSYSKYDIIFMDCMMPRLDGYMATQKLREAGHKIPIIALTANSMEREGEKCLAAGMNDYVTKPVKEQELYGALVKYVQNSEK